MSADFDASRLIPPGVRRALRLPASRTHLSRELDDEMRFHIEMRVGELRAKGYSESDARAEAMRRFGDPDDLRDYCQSIEVPHMRRLHMRDWLDGWKDDIRFASRQFRRTPGFVAAVVITLSLGIGASTAIFSVVNGVMLRALPYRNADRIVQVWELSAKGVQNQVSDPNFDDLRSQSRSFAFLAEVAPPSLASVSGGSEPVRAGITRVSRGFFGIFGVQPVLGRLFVDEEERQNGPRAAVVSHDFWQRNFSGAASILGSPLRVGDETFTVVGVLPPEMAFPAETDLWVSREVEARNPYRTGHNWLVIGLLRDGTTLAEAQAEASAIAKRLQVELGNLTDMFDAGVVSLRDQMVGAVRRPLLLLLAASIVLLLIACANALNLLIARMAARQGEVAVRLALGAARHRLVQQCVAEALMLSLAGGALGVLLAVAGVKLLLALQTGSLPRVNDIRIDWSVVVFALALSTVTAGVLGLLTAWRGTHADLRAALSQAQRTQSGAGTSARVRQTLVVAQVAMTLVLLVGAGLLARSFLRLLAVDPGYRTSGAVVLDVIDPSSGQEALRARARFHDDLMSRLRALPGVSAVGGVNAMPLSSDGTSNGIFLIMSRIDEEFDVRNAVQIMRDPARTGQAEFRLASAGYFEAMKIPLVRGRLFDGRDTPEAPHVAVISASLAQKRWPNEDPIGKIIQFGNMDGDLRPFTIIGIVGDIRQWGLDRTPRPTFYGLSRQRPVQTERFNIVIATSGPTAPVIARARQIVRDLRPDIPPRFRTIESLLSSSLADRRFVLFLIGVFGATALLLAMLGVYSVISYLVTQRARELSIRVALGARGEEILRLMLGQGMTLALIGIAVGALASVGLTRLLQGMLYEVSATDPIAFVSVAAVLAVVALLASLGPARRAANVDAMDVLRGG